MTSADLLPAAVLKRKAVVYVRQSTQAQVQTNLESQRRQYELVDIARRRGFRDVEVIDVGNILFASEMLGAVPGVDPETGFHFDDTKRYVDALGLSEEDGRAVFEANVRRVYPRLDRALQSQGR